MKKKNPCPYKALVIVADAQKKVEEKSLEVLSSFNISRSMISSAQGTAPSNLSDFFGFGIVDRMVISTFIDADKAGEIVTKLSQTLQFDENNHGIIFTLPLTALSSNIINLWREA